MTDDQNEMARLHSAGATIRHNSPFTDLPSHKNETELSADFIKKWVVPFYMEITSYDSNNWIDAIKEIKGEITKDMCLSLLGDFNWRTRLVGAYFASVKGYNDLIGIIGIHLLKSEVCCVGHIYALTLAFFKTSKSIEFLDKYLDYYLTKPNLYFDQKSVMEALLYLDKASETSIFKKHIDNWKLFEHERKMLQQQSALAIAKKMEEEAGKNAADDYQRSFSAGSNEEVDNLTTAYFDKQIPILLGLNRHSN